MSLPQLKEQVKCLRLLVEMLEPGYATDVDKHIKGLLGSLCVHGRLSCLIPEQPEVGTLFLIGDINGQGLG